MGKTNTEFVKDKIAELRMRLLDLTNRNALLNFRHSEKALTHIRIIDELPDFLFGSLIEGEKLTFLPLPEPDDEPHDEKTDKFQTHFREATLTDEEYLDAVAELVDQDDSFDEMAILERDLKNRVRKRLKMPPADELKPLSSKKWAKENNLEPKYDMPLSSEEEDHKPGKHYDEYIQTLLKPKELQHKLSGLRRYINTDINETGVNTFYAAFGFLERYDSENSDRPFFAPLVLLQLNPPTEKKTADGEVFVSVSTSGEEPQYNLPLAEKLKEFGIELPELSGDDTPESYMDKVERLVKNQKKWRVRRFITFGRFQFARLVMYHDLDPERWPDDAGLAGNEIINSLIAGGKESADSNVSDEALIYDIDTDPEVEEAAPIMIMEADSSQHSAIVDALKGNNLVIKGPPGTGKSQTITNLIANALAKDKKVLFIAEKMAALNVVYSRLQSVGLGDYCFELHSTKAKLKDIKKGLATTIENRASVTRPSDLQKSVIKIKEAKTRLREYSDIVNQPFGESGKTIHEIMWGEQSRRANAENLPVSIKKTKVDNALSYTQQKLENLCEELRQLETLEAENKSYSKNRHPWIGVRVTQSSSLKAQEIIQAYEESGEALEKLFCQIARFEEEFQWTAKQTISEWRQASYECNKICEFKDGTIDFDLLERLGNQDGVSAAQQLSAVLNTYDKAIEEIAQSVKDPSILIGDMVQASKFCKQAHEMKVDADNVESLEEQLEQQGDQITQWEKASGSFDKVGAKIFGSSATDLDLKNLRLLIKAAGFLSEVDRDLLFLRHEEALNEANKPVLADALNKQKSLSEQQSDLEGQFDLNFDIPEDVLDEAIYELSTANVISFLKPKYYKSWKTLQSASLSPKKTPPQEAANDLRRLKAYKDDKSEFEKDDRYRQVAGTAFNGLHTNFEGLSAINSWAIEIRQEFSGLDENKDRIKQFLLKTDVSDLEAVKDETTHVDAALLLDGITDDNEMSLSDFVTELKRNMDQKQVVCDYLKDNQANDTLTYEKLSGIIDSSVQKASESLKALETDGPSFKATLGKFFKADSTNRNALVETMALNDCLSALELPDSLSSTKYSSKLFSFAKDLSALLKKLEKSIDETENVLNTMQDISQLDVQEYIGAAKLQDANLAELSDAIKSSLDNKEALNTQMGLTAFLENAKSQPYGEVLKTLRAEGLDYQGTSQTFEYLYYRTVCREAFGRHDILDDYKPHWLNGIREGFQELDRKIIKLNCQELAYKLAQSQPPEGISRGRVSEYTEMGLIRHQALKEKTRAVPIRKLIKKSGRALQSLKPCFLMSPLSVAQYVDTHGIKFDMVVIDEASQMRPEDALGAIGRSGQIVVVGDPKQLPPTDFFSKQTFKDTDYDDEDKIDNESILDLALGRFRPTRDLLWHYRSRHESLIAFSNAHFYDDRLIVFPSPEDRSENFGVHCHYVGGTYNASCNVDEAVAVMEGARKFMRDHPDKSLGIATMNSSQRDLIHEEMYRLFLNDEVAEAYKQKWEETLEPFFVKNLESVQGDERDAIFVSTVYGPNKDGTVMQRFGPINGKQGHRRLNVLFTRAKHNLVLYTSLRPDDIKATETSALGLRAFKGYLEYAYEGKLDAGSVDPTREPDSDFEVCVMERLQSIGYEVVPQVGVAGYFIDLGIKHPNYPYGFLMGIECDGAMYHSSKSARDRDRIRQEVLEGLGWEIYRIWSTDWFHNPTNEFEKLKAHIDETVKRKNAEKEQKEKERLSNVVELQQRIQEDLFAEDRQDKTQVSAQATTSDAAPQPKASNDNVVELFDTVSFKFIDDQEPSIRTVTIVSSQSDVDTGNINQHSAMGRALLGSEVDEEVEVSLPNGSKTLQITKIQKAEG